MIWRYFYSPREKIFHNMTQYLLQNAKEYLSVPPTRFITKSQLYKILYEEKQ